MTRKIQRRILVVEDESHIAEGLKLNLTLSGYVVEIAVDGRDALDKWKSWNPDLIVLDIMLPVLDGFSVLQNIRLEDEAIPILILTAKSDPDDKVKGLSFGVDDYLTKPFHLEEFLLRIERLLKRARQESFPDDLPHEYEFGDNRINFKTAEAVGVGGKFRLTEQEVKLLKLFVLNRGKPLPRNQLLKIGWGMSDRTNTRTVDNFIVRLRKYFEKDPKHPEFFISLRSVGYVFNNPYAGEAGSL